MKSYQWHLLGKSHLERRVSEADDRLDHTIKSGNVKTDTKDQKYLVRVVHAHGDTCALEIIHIEGSGLRSVGGRVDELELSGSRNNEISRSILGTPTLARAEGETEVRQY